MDGLFRDLAGLGSFRLGLTGGEPLLRKDLFDVLDAAPETLAIAVVRGTEERELEVNLRP
jgi:MoaA/NifB/PqqE/SkfB family radical SAM enzyme